MHLIVVLIKFSIVLGIMVLVHELGHFIVAKLCGVTVETFSIGFGPRLLGLRRGGTDYRLSLLPLGGYVKMAGEYGVQPGLPDDPEERRATQAQFAGYLTSKPRWQRVLIALGGPVANVLLAFVILTMVAHFHYEVDQYRVGPAALDYVPEGTPAAKAGMGAGDTIVAINGVNNPTWDDTLKQCALNLNRSVPITFIHNGGTKDAQLSTATGGGSDITPETIAAIGLLPREQTGPLEVDSVAGGTPAARAGLQSGDKIERIDDLEPHSVSTLHAYLKDRSGAPATLKIERAGKPLTVVLTPERVEGAPAYAQYQIGFTPVQLPVEVKRKPLGEAMQQSLVDNRDDSLLIFHVLQGMFTRHVSVKSLSGPVGIAQQIDLATKSDFPWILLRLMSSISINLAIFNLLPFPPLDGGMIFFLLLESVLRRDVNQEVKDRIYQIAFVCVVGLAVFVMYNDIVRLHLGSH